MVKILISPLNFSEYGVFYSRRLIGFYRPSPPQLINVGKYEKFTNIKYISFSIKSGIKYCTYSPIQLSIFEIIHILYEKSKNNEKEITFFKNY